MSKWMLHPSNGAKKLFTDAKAALLIAAGWTETTAPPGEIPVDPTPQHLTAEDVRDVIGAALRAGTNVSIVVNDAGDTITISATGGTSYTDEQVRDAVAAALRAGTGVTITNDDAGDTITIAATGLQVNTTGAAVGKVVAVTGTSPTEYGLVDPPTGTGAGTASPLSAIAKAQTSPFKVMLLGTSKQSFDRSPIQVFGEHLKSLYGDAGAFQVRPGALGSFLGYSGWKSQRFGGPFQYRLAGTSASTAFTLPFYGDTLTLEFSRETDSVACNILIDGSVVGQTPAAGAQAYSLAQTFTVPVGAHTVSVAVPAGAGSVYWEHMTGGLAARAGVEVRDCTLGGSLMGNMVNVGTAGGSEAATLPIVGDNGINATFDRPDVDLFVMGYIVNDAGTNSGSLAHYTTVWKPTMDKIVALTAKNGAKLLLVVEMAGHYVMPNDAGSTTRHLQFEAMAAYYRTLAATYNHVSVVDHHAATVMPDLQAYADRYFPNAGTLNLAAGTFSGSDFIHEDPASGGPAAQIGVELLCKACGVVPARRILASLVRDDRLRTLPNVKAAQDRKVTVGGATRRVATVNGAAALARATGTSSAFQCEQVPYIRDGSVPNLAAALQSSIDASGTVDDVHGPYLAWSNQTLTLPASVNWAGGERRILTVRARGTVELRASGVSKLYPSATGSAMAVTDVGNDRTACRYVLAGSEPAVFSVIVGATNPGGALAISGEVFAISLVDADVPVLSKDAPNPVAPPLPLVVSGRSFFPVSGQAAGTSTGLGIGTLRAVPWTLPQAISIDRVGAEVSTAGEAGSLVRLGIYADNGNGQPGALILDAGTIAGDSATVQAITVDKKLPAGTYWLGGVVQNVTTTQPTLRTAAQVIPPFPLDHGTGNPNGGATNIGYHMTGVTGALPAQFSGSPTLTTLAARLFMRRSG